MRVTIEDGVYSLVIEVKMFDNGKGRMIWTTDICVYKIYTTAERKPRIRLASINKILRRPEISLKEADDNVG